MIEHIGKKVMLDTELEHDVESGPRFVARFDGAPFSGISRSFRRDGSLEADHTYFRGYNDGPVWWYNPDGSLDRIEGYYNKQPHGDWEYYAKDGRLFLKKSYFIRLLIREYWMFPDGQILEKKVIESNPTEMREYEQRLLVAKERNHLIPSIRLPIVDSFSVWESEVLDRLANETRKV